MQIISDCTLDAIKASARALKAGNLVAFPTETVYGLGADATNEKAVSRIYLVKNRPINHPLIVHISSANKLRTWSDKIPNYAFDLAKAFWPGPMTLILPKTNLVKNYLTGGQNNIALRVPYHQIALELLMQFEKIGGVGVAAPSANRFGAVSPTNAGAVYEELGDYCSPNDVLLDGGRCKIGLESTIIDCTQPRPRVLRPGAITNEMIELHSNSKIDTTNFVSSTIASGMLRSHYSPRAKVVLNTLAKAGEGFIALAKVPTPIGAIRLGTPKTNEEFAQQIYELLRLGDANGLPTICVILPEDGALHDAIADRMSKAAQD